MNMTTKNKWSGALLAVAITLVAGGVKAQDQQRQQRTPEGAVTVNDLASKPGEHLGQVQLIGVVAAVSQGQGFVCRRSNQNQPVGVESKPATFFL